MSTKLRFASFGDKAKTCTLSREGASRNSPRSGPLKGCKEDCWDYEGCVRLAQTGSLIISNRDKESC